MCSPPSLIFSALLLVSFIQSHSGLTSHSLRHHGSATHATPGDGNSRPELVVRLHEEVVLACDSNRVLAWKHNGKSVQHSAAYRVTANTLRIMKVTNQDEGPWQCEELDAKSRVLVATRAVWIVVMEIPKGAFLSFDGKRASGWLNMKEGAPLKGRCLMDGGKPAPTAYDWWLESPDGEQESLANFSTGADLAIDKILRDMHNGTIICSISHVALDNPMNTSAKVNITYSPSFAISRIPGFGFPLREGLAVSLKCDVDSNPPSRPIWMKDDGDPPVEQSPDGYLNFSSISREHIGWYKCSAEYDSSTYASSGLFINVRYEEVFTKQPPRQVEVALGGGVTLDCGDSGVSTTGPNCWGRLSGNRLEAVGAGPQLRLDSVLYQEAGAYRCVAPEKPDPLVAERKAMLTPPQDIELVVTGQPVVYPIRRNLTAVGGSQLSLSVEFCANPEATHAFWLTPTVALRPGQEGGGYIAQNVTEGDSAHCRRAALTIPGVYLEHAGEYLFVVRSLRGMADGMVLLNVTRGASYYSTKRAWSNSHSKTVVVVPKPPPSIEDNVQDEPRPEVTTEAELVEAAAGAGCAGAAAGQLLLLLLASVVSM
ncbi:Hypothetical predicted protein [Cloeon dipterum]|uniref:Ig-like domain-containing protein n=2 Tax=Cloeon dipterum TaxID=197152 RepID=A0A8S1CQY3_9INSE|nr:Hypothetical predicted protein [Cloeon dipterum]